MIKSRRMRWARYVAWMGIRGIHTRFWWEYQKERDHKDALYLDGRIILKWILEKYGGRYGQDSSGISYITLAWFCLHRHVTRFRGLITETLLSALRLSVYRFVVAQQEDTTSTIPQLLCTYMAVRNWCLTLPSCGCLCNISLIP
jgi:hypothetical protein